MTDLVRTSPVVRPQSQYDKPGPGLGTATIGGLCAHWAPNHAYLIKLLVQAQALPQQQPQQRQQQPALASPLAVSEAWLRCIPREPPVLQLGNAIVAQAARAGTGTVAGAGAGAGAAAVDVPCGYARMVVALARASASVSAGLGEHQHPTAVELTQ